MSEAARARKKAKTWLRSFAVEFTKRRLRELRRAARAAGQPSPLEKSDAHLYLAVSTYVRNNYMISEPIGLQDLSAIMHSDARTITRSRKRLEVLGEVIFVEGGQGKADVRFALPKLIGPIGVGDGGVAICDVATSGAMSEVRSDTVSQALRTPRPKLSSDTLFPSRSRSVVRSTQSNAKVFWDWFRARWVEYADVPYPSDFDADIEVIAELLAHASLEQLQSRAQVMWATQRDHRDPWCRCDPCWVARSDCSLRVLKHKTLYLAREAERFSSVDAPPAAVLETWIAICDRVAERASADHVERLRGCELFVRHGVATVHGLTKAEGAAIPDSVHEVLQAVLHEILGVHQMTFYWAAIDERLDGVEARQNWRAATRASGSDDDG